MTAPGQIGLPPPVGAMNLKKFSGLEWQFRWYGGEFPAGSQLYLLVGDDDTPQRWDFTISGDMATIAVKPEVTATIPDRTAFYLMFKANAAALPVQLEMGKVKQWKAK